MLRAEQEKLFDLERTQADQIIGTDQYKILGAQIDRQREYMSDLDGRIAQENELEMAVLKQNQTLQALQPITDGLGCWYHRLLYIRHRWIEVSRGSLCRHVEGHGCCTDPARRSNDCAVHGNCSSQSTCWYGRRRRRANTVDQRARFF